MSDLTVKEQRSVRTTLLFLRVQAGDTMDLSRATSRQATKGSTE